MKLAIFTHSKSAFFVQNIQQLLFESLDSLGINVVCLNESHPVDYKFTWNIILFPDEFFILDREVPEPPETLPDNIIIVNGEQRRSPWYKRAIPYILKSAIVWDIDYDTAIKLNKEGILSYFLPLGYKNKFLPYSNISTPPRFPKELFIGKDFYTYTSERLSFSNRPIDILFIGRLSDYRNDFFVKNSESLSKYECFFCFSDAVSPRHSINISQEMVISLCQRSKIILNLHHGANSYFEWHRIIHLGIWQKALVVSEPCSFNPYFFPNTDYIEVLRCSIADKINFLLTTEKGQILANNTINKSFNKLKKDVRLSDILLKLLGKIR